jgi:hypothetical protein
MIVIPDDEVPPLKVRPIKAIKPVEVIKVEVPPVAEPTREELERDGRRVQKAGKGLVGFTLASRPVLAILAGMYMTGIQEGCPAGNNSWACLGFPLTMLISTVVLGVTEMVAAVAGIVLWRRGNDKLDRAASMSAPLTWRF